MAEINKCMIISAVPLADGSLFEEFNPKDYLVI